MNNNPSQSMISNTAYNSNDIDNSFCGSNLSGYKDVQKQRHPGQSVHFKQKRTTQKSVTFRDL